MKDVYHALFEKVSTEEGLQQSFFADRCSGIRDCAVLAYDSTTVSTYSGNLLEAHHGFNKAGDRLGIIRPLTLYSIGPRQ